MAIGSRLAPATIRIRGAWGDARWCGLVLELVDAVVLPPDPATSEVSEGSFEVSSQLPPVFQRPALLAQLHGGDEDDDDALTDTLTDDGTFRTEVCLATMGA